MKKTMISFALGLGVGFFCNTESGKKLRNWLFDKGQEYKNTIVDKINEVTSDSLTSETGERK